jgi:hypothetical protein
MQRLPVGMRDFLGMGLLWRRLTILCRERICNLFSGIVNERFDQVKFSDFVADVVRSGSYTILPTLKAATVMGASSTASTRVLPPFTSSDTRIFSVSPTPEMPHLPSLPRLREP